MRSTKSDDCVFGRKRFNILGTLLLRLKIQCGLEVTNLILKKSADRVHSLNLDCSSDYKF